MKNLRNTIVSITLLTALWIGAASAAHAEEAASTQVININTAASAELEALPGIGPSKAKDIIEYRSKHPFTKVEDIMRVKGIGRKSFLKMKPYLAVSGGTQIAKKSTPTQP